MSKDKSLDHEVHKRVQRTDHATEGHEGSQAHESESVPSYPASLLSDVRLGGRGNGPVRTALMLQMQRTYGNRAVQRFLQRSAHPVAPEPVLQREGPSTTFPDAPSMKGQANLSINFDTGQIEITVVGPEDMPIVKSPTIGARRDPDGKWHLLIGGKDTVVSADEIPGKIREAVGASAKGGSSGKQKTIMASCPTCRQLRHDRGGGYKTFQEYQINQRLWHGKLGGGAPWLELTPSLYEALIEGCRKQDMPLEVPPAQPPEYNDLPDDTSEPDTAVV